jgi:RND family efflux transporter MFP subunit
VPEKTELLRSLRIERGGESEGEQASASFNLPVLGAVAASALLVGGLVGWLGGWYLKPAPPPPVVEAPVASRSGSTSAGGLVASGYVVARRMATVAAEVTGRVLEVRVEEGQVVRRGQILAVLEPTLARAEFSSATARTASAEADYAEARRVLTRTQELAARGYASNAALTAAQSRAAQAEAQRNSARSDAQRAAAQLARYEIRAPFSGVVVNKSAQPGEIISPMSAGGGFTRTGICTIVDMESLEIEVDVSEAFISRVEAGQRVEAILEAYPDVMFPAHVIATIPAASRDRATVRVRIGFDALDPRILPEMAINVTFMDGAT